MWHGVAWRDMSTGDLIGIRDARKALDVVDIDGDGKIGFLDFVHFASRLKHFQQQEGTQ